MNFLASIVTNLLKWVLPLAIHELMAYLKKIQAERAEKKHEKAKEDLKNAKTEEEQKDALRDLADNP